MIQLFKTRLETSTMTELKVIKFKEMLLKIELKWNQDLLEALKSHGMLDSVQINGSKVNVHDCMQL